MNRPSADQETGALFSADSRTGISLSAPLTDFRNTSWTTEPCRRDDPKARRLPSGDQVGYDSLAVSDVNRRGAPRATSINQMSPLLSIRRSTATMRASGDIAHAPSPPTSH